QDPPIVHGGIHPTQILVGNHHGPRLFDFGIVSTVASLDPPPSQATVAPSNPRGGYYAPELLEQGPPTPPTDVYAFAGVMLSLEDIVINESQATKSGPTSTQGLQEAVPEDDVVVQMEIHPQIQRLIEEALRVLNPRTLGETALASDLLKRLDREVAPDIEGELDILHKDIADGSFSRVSMGLWKKPLPSGLFSTTTVAVKLLRLRVEGTLAEKRARVHL
ncbi:hypothetical protein FRC01_013999, partial [Tulasnella sp. 417]